MRDYDYDKIHKGIIECKDKQDALAFIIAWNNDKIIQELLSKGSLVGELGPNFSRDIDGTRYRVVDITNIAIKIISLEIDSENDTNLVCHFKINKVNPYKEYIFCMVEDDNFRLVRRAMVSKSEDVIKYYPITIDIFFNMYDYTPFVYNSMEK